MLLGSHLAAGVYVPADFGEHDALSRIDPEMLVE